MDESIRIEFDTIFFLFPPSLQALKSFATLSGVFAISDKISKYKYSRNKYYVNSVIDVLAILYLFYNENEGIFELYVDCQKNTDAELIHVNSPAAAVGIDRA